MRSLEEEKIFRKTLEGNLAKIKDESAKSDLQKEKTIIDLSLRLEKSQIERQQYELELIEVKKALHL